MWRKATVLLLGAAIALGTGGIAVAVDTLTKVNFHLAVGANPASLAVYYDAASMRSYATALDLAALLGAEVKSDADGVGTDIVRGSTTLELFADANKAMVNGSDTAIDPGARLVGGALYVPVRFTAEHLGYTVSWNGDSQQIALTQNVADVNTNPPATHTVSIPGDQFLPRALEINAGDTVIWNNGDADLHTVVSVPDAPDKVVVSVASGKQGQFTFTKPGVYHYYCSMHASYDADTTLIKAAETSDMFPAAMEGVIVVRGPDFKGPATASVNIPGDRFAPFVTVVKAGGTVTWTNKDTDMHTVQTIPGAPDSVTLVIKSGADASFTFKKPGIYEYYCTMHALWDDKAKVVKAIKTSDAYPKAMNGYVVVLP